MAPAAPARARPSPSRSLALPLVLWLLWARGGAAGELRVSSGVRLPDHARIFGGLNASAHEFPTQVYISSVLQNGDEPPYGIFCGGSILSEKWILTAAHCVKNSVHTLVGFGTSNKDGLEFHLASRTLAHAGYMLYGRNDNNAANDLGLVEVSPPLPLDGSTVRAVRLADAQLPLPGGRGVVVVGWGRWTYDIREYHSGSAAVLKKLDVHIFPCHRGEPDVICIQTDAGTGICDGDSGGPLLVNGVLYGIASYVDNKDDDPSLDPNLHCNEVGSWAVYMSVPAFRRWIQQHTGV